MDKKSGSSSKSSEKAVDLSSLSLTDRRCAYCKKKGDHEYKCEKCEKMSLPPTFYCSLECKMEHLYDAKKRHICGAARPSRANTTSLTDNKMCSFCGNEGDLKVKCPSCEMNSCPPTFYCSDGCLKCDWNFHKHICGKSQTPAGDTAMGPCPHCGKRAKCMQQCSGPCGIKSNRPTLYCSFKCQMDDIKNHNHICGVAYPRKVDPQNNGIV
jgi:hypothetical protein